MRSRAVLLALGVLLLDRLGGAGVDGLVEAPVQVGELAGRGVDRSVDVSGPAGTSVPSPGWCAHLVARLLIGVRAGPWANVVPVSDDLTWHASRVRLHPWIVTGWPALCRGCASRSWTEVSSTNAEVVARARAECTRGLVVVAEHQTAAGVGSTGPGRRRLAPRCSSRCCRGPPCPPGRGPGCPCWSRRSPHQALRERGYAAGLKWPNDLLIGERKIVGILVERVETPDGPAAVVGVGLNVALTAGRAARPDGHVPGHRVPARQPDRTAAAGRPAPRPP